MFVILTSVLAVSCASIASPSGGDFDFDPPVVVKSTPSFNQTNVASHKIEIEFDEFVKLDQPMDKIIVTPPQKRMPKIQAISKKVTVELKDTLQPNTTYTIDFTDAIQDNNEGNPLENFSLSFSTGDIIDSLAISGTVLSADNLEPVKGIYVGLHSDLSDTAFLKIPFKRISRTNDKGQFTIRGIAEGKYRIYALDDISRSYIYENMSSAIAYNDSTITPSFTQAVRTDTVFKQDLTVDTVIDVKYTRFLPDDIILRSFVSAFQRQYLQKHERIVPDELNIIFGAPTEMPQIEPLNFDGDKDWAVLEKSVKNDTLHYWITDPMVAEIDTIALQMTYNVTDTLNNIVSQTDTLNFINRRKRNTEKKEKKKDKEEESITFLSMQSNMRGSFDILDTIRITFDQPVMDFDPDKFKLQRFQVEDSTYIDDKIEFYQDKYNPRKFSFFKKWEPGAQYIFYTDSATLHSYSGMWNNKYEEKFRIKNVDEYGNLYIDISGKNDSLPAFVELLDASDKPLRKSTVKDGGVLFRYLNPGKYYARIVMDKNGNGIWDTGDYYEDLQPEEVFYYDKYFDIKANWDIEESWNIRALSVEKQKPLEITKNKPQEKSSRRKQLEKEEEKRKQQDKKNQQQQQNQQSQFPSSPIDMRR